MFEAAEAGDATELAELLADLDVGAIDTRVGGAGFPLAPLATLRRGRRCFNAPLSHHPCRCPPPWLV